MEESLATERGNDGPYFNGDQLCLVDASYAPFLYRFALIEQIIQSGLLADYPLVQAWTDALVATEHVTKSIAPEFEEVFVGGLTRRETYAGTVLARQAAAG